MSPRSLVATLVAMATALAAVVAASCTDPTHAAEVNALGGEVAGVPTGPTHRAGQPCLTCHGGLGPANSTFVTAGTAYALQYPMDGGPNTTGFVYLVDSVGSTYVASTNEVGNFYVPTGSWNAVFPLGARQVDAGVDASPNITVTHVGVGGYTSRMVTAIDRGGVYASCGYCHFDPPGPTSPGHIY